MSIVDPAISPGSAAQDVLRKLALKAQGLTGADIARLVREARQKARRESRTITFADIFAIVDAAKPAKSAALLHRMAVHEAGHALVALALDIGAITIVTIDGVGGAGYVETTILPQVETETAVVNFIAYRLAGRAAEEVIFGSVVAGSGGTPESDLAKATRSAMDMETTLGFAVEQPLLYRAAGDRSSVLTFNPMIAERVNARLEVAYSQARVLIQKNRGALDVLIVAILEHNTLEGPVLEAVVADIRKVMAAEEIVQ